MRQVSFFSLFILTLALQAQSYNGPESVEFDYANNRYLVANKNNGQVIARAANGTLSVFASGMSSGPYGIEILGNTLYCCYGGGKVRGFDLTTKAQVMDVNLGGTFLNGIISDGVKNLYITDFSAKKIYRLNTLTQQFNVFTSGLAKSPNGIIFDGANNRCVFVSWGTAATILSLNLADSTTSILATTSFSNIDGIAKDPQNNYFISVWGNNSVQKYTGGVFSSPTLVISGLSSPADLFYNVVSDTLAIPNSGTANNVVFVGFSTATGIMESSKRSVVYPNPMSDFICVDVASPANLSLYSVSGQLILEKEITGKEWISVIDLPTGVYQFVLRDDNNVSTGKVIKH